MIVNLRSSKIIFDHHWSMMTESHPAVEKNQPLPLSFCREIVCWRGKEKERGKQWSLLIIDDQCNRRLPSTTVDSILIDWRLKKIQRWKSSSCNDQHTVNDDLRWSKWWFLTDPMINIDLNISTVQLINIASTLIIGKIKDHRMIILESSMINVDIFSKILGICPIHKCFQHFDTTGARVVSSKWRDTLHLPFGYIHDSHCLFLMVCVLCCV